jgi:two-component system nitrate/nitrite response regulator NarL
MSSKERSFMSKRIRVVIADDHPLFREGVGKTLSDLANCEVVATCANADDALKAVREHLPDVVLLDISMPGGGIDAARQIAAACPVVRILMLTASESESDVMEALEVGACGYALKGIGGNELADIIQTVHDGGVYVSPGLAARMLVDIKDHQVSQPSDLFSDLTAREEQILKRVAKGLSNKEVALDLTLSEKTVKHYMTNILQKLQVRNRVEAAIKARDHYAADGTAIWRRL